MQQSAYPCSPGLFRRLRHPTLIVASMLVLAALLMLSGASQAQDEGPGELYIPLAEPLVVNYGGPGRLKYLRAEMSIRIGKRSDASVIRHHMPLIRHTLVMLFSRQEEQDVNTQQGREQLRQLALDEINQLFAREEGRNDIARDLLFNNFVVQR